MAKHEFGILQDFDKDKIYEKYEPEKYNCVSVSDELIAAVVPYLKNMKTYHHSFNNKSLGLAYTGITIIPTSSITFFYDLVNTLNKLRQSHELAVLLVVLMDAKINNKNIIHFGI